MEYISWRNRITNRTDLVARITHLTRGRDDDSAFDILWKILSEKKLIGSGKSGFIVGDVKAVCFQEVPLASIAENLLYEGELQDKTRYSWFGLRFNKVSMHKMGARPVFYGKKEVLKQMLPEDEWWRIVSLDLDAEDIIDWSHEREWRFKGNLCFEYDDIEILVKNDVYYRKLVEKCIEEKRVDILKRCHGIIALNSVLS